MTDREMLEWAAKAAGLRIDKAPDNGGGWWNTGFDVLGNVVLDWHNGETWNPLTDDGDALRLAVRLAMTVRQEPSAVAVGWDATCLAGAPTPDGCGPWFWKEWLSDGQDPCGTTRRAIVRAAAEIGRAKEQSNG